MKTSEAYSLKNTLNGVKWAKMQFGKVKMVRILCKLDEALAPFNRLRNELQDKLSSEYKDFTERYRKAHEYEKALSEGKKPEIGQEEYQCIVNEVIEPFDRDFSDALKPELDKEIDTDYPRMNDDEYNSFIEANNFDEQKLVFLAKYLLADL